MDRKRIHNPTMNSKKDDLEIQAIKERIDSCEALLSQLADLVTRNQELTTGIISDLERMISLYDQGVHSSTTDEDHPLNYFQ